MKQDRNPYNGFKSDRERRWALLARDVRIVATELGRHICIAATAIALAYLGAPEHIIKAVAQAVRWWP